MSIYKKVTGSKITANGACSHEIKRHLLLGRKAMTNLDCIWKSRDITLPTNVHLVKLCFFQWSCTDVRVGLWRKLSTEELLLLNCGVGEDSWESLGLQSNQSILKISPGISLEGMMLKLKLQYFGHLMRRVLIGKDSDAGRDWGQEEKGTTEDEMAGWHHWLDGRESE